jgi:biopolymer transport protein ExbD
MKSSIRITSPVLVSLLFIFLAGCHQSQVSKIDKSKMPTADSPYVKVFVNKSGEITLDGKPTDLEGLKTAFAALAQKKGLVLYARENPEAAQPHPNAMEVIKLVVENKLPVRLCKTNDCSDALDANGKVKVGQ